jgi:hypothetical protein
VPNGIAPDPFSAPDVILVTEEGLLAAIAALGNVVRVMRDHDSGHAGHGAEINA